MAGLLLVVGIPAHKDKTESQGRMPVADHCIMCAPTTLSEDLHREDSDILLCRLWKVVEAITETLLFNPSMQLLLSSKVVQSSQHAAACM